MHNDYGYDERQKFIKRYGTRSLTLDEKRQLLIDELRAEGKYLPESTRDWDRNPTILKDRKT